jgi:hypothetical protein
MNELTQRLCDISIDNTERTHMILDKVLMLTARSFPDCEIRFNQDNVAFEFTINNLGVIITRDLNRFTVNTRVVSNNTVIAECAIDCAGGFDERYTKFESKEMKLKFAELFTSISEIDVNHALPSTEDPNVPDEEETPHEDEDADVEVEVENEVD